MSASSLTEARLLHGATGAVISSCEQYRYWLHRSWLHGIGWTVFVMLNPSTADAAIDDPTIRRCIGFAKRLGSMGVIVVNLYGARSTDPDALWKLNDPVGPENHAYIVLAAELAAQQHRDREGHQFVPGHVICAWGAHPIALNQQQTALGWIAAAGATPMCLGKTKMGHPRHPLYVPSIEPLIAFEV